MFIFCLDFVACDFESWLLAVDRWRKMKMINDKRVLLWRLVTYDSLYICFVLIIKEGIHKFYISFTN
jgi:hypothetical protein